MAVLYTHKIGYGLLNFTTYSNDNDTDTDGGQE